MSAGRGARSRSMGWPNAQLCHLARLMRPHWSLYVRNAISSNALANSSSIRAGQTGSAEAGEQAGPRLGGQANAPPRTSRYLGINNGLVQYRYYGQYSYKSQF